MVRALPLASACLISVVSLRVSVIFFFSCTGAVGTAQVFQQLILILFRQWI
jgi:hypothetical protein